MRTFNWALQLWVTFIGLPIVLISCAVHAYRVRSSDAIIMLSGAILGIAGYFVAKSSLGFAPTIGMFEGIEREVWDYTAVGHTALAARSVGILLFAYGLSAVTCGTNFPRRLPRVVGLRCLKDKLQHTDAANSGSAGAPPE